jgi:ATP-binding cassette subfamily B (MDR/TAP) protein 1
MCRQEIGFFDLECNSAGELSSFLAQKVTLIETLTSGSLQAMLRGVTCIATMLTIIFGFGPWQLGLAILGALPVLVICMVSFLVIVGGGADEMAKNRGKQPTGKKAVAERGEGALIGEVVQSIRTVASFGAEEKFFADYCKSVDRLRSLELSAAPGQGLALGFAFSMILFLFSFVYFYGGYLNNAGKTDFRGMLIPVFMMFGASLTMISAIAGLKDAKLATQAAVRFFAITDRASCIDPMSMSGLCPTVELRGEVEVRDVTFAYPSAPQHLVCQGYSLHVPAGATVALCGPSGSGKSTLIALIERFYDPQEGCVLLDSVDVRTLNVRWLRQQLGLVAQEPVLFMGSVAENIAYGKDGATRAEVEEAARLANAHSFIVGKLSDGYDTQVGQGGGKLSGGQKQRIAIARAIVRRPAVLLLDEATSALDNESERVVQAALDSVMAKMRRTTIVIAHRLSTIRSADRIAVVNQGAVVEEGTHDELMAIGDGLYQKLSLQS